jgi:uncharacterized membrane protein YphA (DoxX/SURF4 family)
MVVYGVRLGRTILATAFVYAAWTKLRQPWEIFALSIDSYGILPEWAVIALARVLPWLELVLGLLLLLGVWLVAVGGAVSLLLLGFMVAMLRAWWLDLGVDCGCFGIGQAVSPGTLARDGALTLLSMLVTAGALVLSRRASPAPVRSTAGDGQHVPASEKSSSSPGATTEARLAGAIRGAPCEESRP